MFPWTGWLTGAVLDVLVVSRCLIPVRIVVGRLTAVSVVGCRLGLRLSNWLKVVLVVVYLCWARVLTADRF